MLEMTLVLIVMSILLKVGVSSTSILKMPSHPQDAQIKAMISRQRQCDLFGVCFNAHGHISKAQSVRRDFKLCVYQLG